jgi:hypothetical protein
MTAREECSLREPDRVPPLLVRPDVAGSCVGYSTCRKKPRGSSMSLSGDLVPFLKPVVAQITDPSSLRPRKIFQDAWESPTAA